REEGQEWSLDAELVLLRLRPGFLFQGCRRGILFASNSGEPSLDSMVSTLWDLVKWARKPWEPADGSAEAKELREREGRIRGERWLRLGWVVLVVVLVLWLRAAATASLLTLLIVLGRDAHDGQAMVTTTG